ncbi:MAG: indolepyruvate oxidoreductase subunit beta [Chloroflexota bacterium]
MKKLDLLLVGVGGQGVILASDIIGETALAAGYDVKKTDTLGMAQRGGSVISHLRIAERVWSPLAREGEVDLLLGFEKMETARWAYFLRAGGSALVNAQAIPPLAVSLGRDRYPADDEIRDIIGRTGARVCWLEGIRRAQELGNVRALNIFLLGSLSRFLPFEVSAWKESITARLPEKLHQLNLAAFDLGRREIDDGCLR